MPPSISIVIPTWNGLDLLRENLPSVLDAAREYRESRGGETEILVVDDGSQDETLKRLPEEFPQVRWVARPHNGGFAAACNSGFAQCRFDLVALLNNDVRVHPNYFHYQADHFQDPRVFAVTAKVFEPHQPVFATGGRFGSFRRGFWSVYFNYDVDLSSCTRWVEEHRLLSFYAIGGFATYCRRKLVQLEGFNEILSPFHWEDVDLSYRAWKRGWEVHYEPRSLAFHRASSTIDRFYPKKSVDRVSLRNRLLFHWINLHSPSYLLRHLLMLALLLAVRLLVLDLDFYRAFFQALGRWDQVLAHRKREKQRVVQSDAQVGARLKRFYRSAPIQVYYNQREVLQRHPESQGAL